VRRVRGTAVVIGVALLATACGTPAPSPTHSLRPLSQSESPSSSRPPGAVPILFVHGHGTSSAVFAEMVDHLEELGHPGSYLMPIDLVPPNGPNVDAAEHAIGPAVEELVTRTGQSKIDIVAHSMGALSSRWYATKVRPDRVRALLTIGGANHGTEALCGWDDPGANELCPAFSADLADRVQVELNGRDGAPADETPFGRAPGAPGAPSVPADEERTIRYTTVSVPGDEWIRPQSSSRLDGADGLAQLPTGVAVEQSSPGNLLFSEPTDHDAILQDSRFFVLLDAILAANGQP
jgi:pimeloyl-ACP methyl ester carboxylesterase